MTMRTYTLIDQCSGTRQQIQAPSLKSARRQADDWQRDGSYHFESGDSTIWVDTLIFDADGLERLDRVVTAIDPPVPPCIGRRHRWIDDYPAVTASPQGGGVVIRERCNCGWRRRVDTFAQRPDTGERGLRSVSYLAPEVRS